MFKQALAASVAVASVYGVNVNTTQDDETVDIGTVNSFFGFA